MNKKNVEILKSLLNIDLSNDKIELFNEYERIFLEKNAHVNLISKNDEKFLFEKHIFDSLAINKVINKELITISGKNLLDIGTGGGFPSVPIAILYDNLNVYAVDSIRKKIKVIEDIKLELGLKNLFPICERVEKLDPKTTPRYYDYITTRAVAQMNDVLKYAMPKLKNVKDVKNGGCFIAYKSKKALDELKDAETTLKFYNAKIVEIIDYTLPMEEVFERNLIVVGKNNKGL